MNKELFFTVFTPIYNRKHTIHRVWESLNAQTYKNFEWLIVNDGSEDGIEDLLESYKAKADFTVRIFHQKNSGKHIAFNRAIDEAKGDLLIPADSDDRFIETTVEAFHNNWLKYKSDDVSGISVLCLDEQGKVVGDKFPQDAILDYKDIVYKYKIEGEKWGCTRVDILKKYKFPVMEGANFFPESYIWAQIGLNYKTVYLNIPLRIYYQDAGNQLMKVKEKSIGTLKVENYFSIWWLNTIYPSTKEFIGKKDFLTTILSIWKSSFAINKSCKSVVNDLKSNRHKFVAISTYMPSFIMFKILKYKK